MNHGKSQLCVNIKHRSSDGRGRTTKRRGLQRTASGAEEDVDVGRRKQRRELGWGGGRRLSDRWEER